MKKIRSHKRKTKIKDRLSAESRGFEIMEVPAKFLQDKLIDTLEIRAFEFYVADQDGSLHPYVGPNEIIHGVWRTQPYEGKKVRATIDWINFY